MKSTTRSGRFTAYLSRHEYNVMLRDPSWVLVTVRLTADSISLEWARFRLTGWQPTFPGTTARSGAGQSAKLNIPAEVITSGIPRLGEHAGLVW